MLASRSSFSRERNREGEEGYRQCLLRSLSSRSQTDRQRMFQHHNPWRRSRCHSAVGPTETKKTPKKPGAPPKVFHKLSTALLSTSASRTRLFMARYARRVCDKLTTPTNEAQALAKEAAYVKLVMVQLGSLVQAIGEVAWPGTPSTSVSLWGIQVGKLDGILVSFVHLRLSTFANFLVRQAPISQTPIICPLVLSPGN
jgi:hypothetical protein